MNTSKYLHLAFGFVSLTLGLSWSRPSFAILGITQTELGVSYNYRKAYFDATNNTEQQSTTANISLYFLERLALELSVSDSLAVRKEKQPNSSTKLRTQTIYGKAFGADLIYVFAGRKEPFQPFIRAGAAQLERRYVVQDEGDIAWQITSKGNSPSYGAGFRFLLSESFALKVSYNVVQTPTDDNSKAEESEARVGLSWIL